jgi:hypothetical protein
LQINEAKQMGTLPNLRSATMLSGMSYLREPRALAKALQISRQDIAGSRHRIPLYRFLTANVPVVHSCVWTWVRLASAAGEYVINSDAPSPNEAKARDRLERLSDRISTGPTGQPTGLPFLISELFTSLFRDGVFVGVVQVSPDLSGIDRFQPIDSARLRFESEDGRPGLYLEHNNILHSLDRPDVFMIPFGATSDCPFGNSLLQAVPFVAYIEQQLIDDMRRSSHNSGFHRFHVKITPPDRFSGESDTAYANRVNAYFDSTVEMFRSCEVDDNPVTWNNVEVADIGAERPQNATASWFMSHRAMVEEICAATNLSPFLLGYSYGATTTWSGFKFDVVMRQVRAVQAQASQLLEWIGNIELALAGIDARCRFRFDNSFAYQVKDDVAVQTSRIDNILKLYQAGLIDAATAKKETWRIL